MNWIMMAGDDRCFDYNKKKIEGELYELWIYNGKFELDLIKFRAVIIIVIITVINA